MKLIAIFGILILAACTQQPVIDTPVVDLPVEKPTATCTDGILNQAEVDIDCGGTCPACPSCTDGILNQAEEKVDCGGSCTACPTCSDLIKNQGEVGVDCGGPCRGCIVEYLVTAEDATALKDKVKLSTKAGFLFNTYPAGLQVGDTKIFPMAITNTFVDNEKFMVEVEFREAKDDRTNTIPADEATVMKWLERNEFKDYELEQYAQAFIPVGVTVGEEMAPGVDTAPGTYYYRVKITYEFNQYNDREYIDLDFNFKVK